MNKKLEEILQKERDRVIKEHGDFITECGEIGEMDFDDILEESQKRTIEELKKMIEGKRIVVEEKEKGTYYAQHCNGYNQALDDIITELNHQ